MKKIKIFKRIANIMCIVIICVCVGNGFNYLLYDDTNAYMRNTLHQLYTSDENIDILFVGSSHVYRSMNPTIMDGIFHKHTFNLGSSCQYLDGSYAMIKEACKNNDVKQIYLELYYGITEGSEYKEREQNSATYEISDFMKPSFNKYTYLLNASSSDYYDNSFILARRNWENLFSPQYIINLWQEKHTNEYEEYAKTDMGYGNYYVDRGFYANENVVGDNVYWNSKAFGEISALDKMIPDCDWYKSLETIVNYCKNNGIELILYVTPEPEWTLVGKGNYSDYHNRLSRIAETFSVPFYDFNLCKASYFDANDRNLFMDEDHLNLSGANKFSELLSNFFMGNISEEELFYNSYDEKLASEETMVYGIAYSMEYNEAGTRNAYIISNKETGIEYKVSLLNNESGEEQIVQDFSPNINITLQPNEQKNFIISWREADAESNITTIVIPDLME